MHCPSNVCLFPVPLVKIKQKERKSRAHLLNGTASLLLPLVAAQLQGAVNMSFSIIGAQNEQSVGTQQKTKTSVNKSNCDYMPLAFTVHFQSAY